MRHLLAVIALCALAGVALYPFCGFVFRCGCVSMWMGAAARCNVHAAMGPHCPWCEHALLGTAGMVLTLAGQGLLYGAVFWRARSSVTAGLAAALAFPLAAALAAFLTWLPTDYPHFLQHGTRAALGLPAGPIHCVRPSP